MNIASSSNVYIGPPVDKPSANGAQAAVAGGMVVGERKVNRPTWNIPSEDGLSVSQFPIVMAHLASDHFLNLVAEHVTQRIFAELERRGMIAAEPIDPGTAVS